MTNKNQTPIKQQLHKNLLIENKHELYLNKLTEAGYCYSFSLIRAAMHKLGKLAWWEDAVDKIISWDGQAESLDKEYILRDANEGKPITLREIFERVMHYVVFNQASPKKYPYANNSQYNFLRPDGLFMILQDNGEVFRIKQNHTIAGQFTKDDLVNILKDEHTMTAIKNNICLVHSGKHVCELEYKNDTWEFFNPNYKNGKAKSFSSLQDLVNEMTSVLGNNMAIELAALSEIEKPFSYYYDELLAKHPEKLAQDQGFFMFLRFNCDLVPELLNNLKQANKLDSLDLNKLDSKGNTPLIYAVKNNHDYAVKTLLDAGALPNVVASDDYTALMYAVENGHAEIIKLLCEKGADANKKESNGMTFLMHAASRGNTDALKALVNAGALLDEVNSDGYTALMSAVINEHAQACKLLCEKGADFNKKLPNGDTLLINAAKGGNTQILKVLLDAGALPNEVNSNNYPVLMPPVINGHAQVCKLLCEKGADPNKKLANNATFLMFAVKKGYTDVLKVLLDAGALLNEATSDNWTALMFAAQEGQTEAIKILCEKGADANKELPDGGTALLIAAQHGRLDALNALLLNNANPNKTMKVELANIFNFANKKDRKQEVQTLFRQQYEGTIPDKMSGWGALDLAVFFGHKAIVTILLDRIANINIEKLDKLIDLAQAMDCSDITAILKQRQLESIQLADKKQNKLNFSLNHFSLMNKKIMQNANNSPICSTEYHEEIALNIIS